MSQKCTKSTEIIRPWTKSYQFWKWSWPQMADHFLCAFSSNAGNPNFIKFFGHQRAKIESDLNMDMIHLHAKFQAISSMCSPRNVRKTQFFHQGFWQPEGKNTDQNRIISGVVRILQHATFRAIRSMRSETSPGGRTYGRTDRRMLTEAVPIRLRWQGQSLLIKTRIPFKLKLDFYIILWFTKINHTAWRCLCDKYISI